MNGHTAILDNMNMKDLQNLKEYLDARDPVQNSETQDIPAPRRAHWVQTSKDTYYCSSCHDTWNMSDSPFDNGFRYCPYCGAKMISITDP